MPHIQPDPAPPNKTSGVRFDGTINLGHLLTFVGFLVTGGMAWQTLNIRLAVLEERSVTQLTRDATQDMDSKERMKEIREGMSGVSRAIERLTDKIDRDKTK